MYNNTLSLFILTCQVPCVTAQYLLYSKTPVFLLPCPVGCELDGFLNFDYLLCFLSGSCARGAENFANVC